MYDIKILKLHNPFQKGYKENNFFFCNLVDFLYSLSFKFVAPSVGNMCKKNSCKNIYQVVYKIYVFIFFIFYIRPKYLCIISGTLIMNMLN
jgi:hypothetical protein